MVFEFDEPNQTVNAFAIETMLAWLFYYRAAMAQRQGLRHAVMFDEAKTVFGAHREDADAATYPPVTSLMGRVREFGEAVVVADHEPSKLADSLRRIRM